MRVTTIAMSERGSREMSETRHWAEWMDAGVWSVV